MVDLIGKRLKLQQLMVATIADRQHWFYDEVRPMPVPAAWAKGQHVKGDCSKGVQYLCRWANAPDPMQNNWSPYGNSSTIWLALHHALAASVLQVGDIVTFGNNGNDHAAMVLEAGSDPLLWSFGHQGAPDSYRLSADTRPHQLCVLPIVAPPPTMQDKLRAATGYYAWVAWRLGEGPWKPWGPANKSVRPNVPKLIPMSWWRDYVAFLAARKKGNTASI
jgi:hypothetical protein